MLMPEQQTDRLTEATGLLDALISYFGTTNTLILVGLVILCFSGALRLRFGKGKNGTQ